MALSQREKYIAITVGAAIGIFALDKFVWTPYNAAVDKATADRAAIIKRRSAADELLTKGSKLRKMLEEMKANGLLSDTTQAESQAINTMIEWARDCRVNLPAINPERATVEGAFTVLNYHVTATGTTAAISRFLYAIESSPLPLRVSDVTLKSVKEQTDDLQLQMSFSTLCITGDLNRSAKPGAGGSAGSVMASSGGNGGGSTP